MGTAEHKAFSRCSSSVSLAKCSHCLGEESKQSGFAIDSGMVLCTLDWRIKIAAIHMHHTTGIKGCVA